MNVVLSGVLVGKHVEGLPEWWDDRGLIQALKADDVSLFIKVIENKLEEIRPEAQKLLFLLFHRWEDAVYPPQPLKCFEALIKGLTPLNVDINLPCFDHGVYPIHVAACRCYVSTIELLVYYGARTDIPLPILPQSLHFANLIPLQICLHKSFKNFLSRYIIREWKPEQSSSRFLRFLLPLCQPFHQSTLETISVLAAKTERADEILLECAMQGKIIEFTALLMVAYEKVKCMLDRVRQHLHSVEELPFEDVPVEELPFRELPQQSFSGKEALVCMRQLVEVFDKAGDEISTYVKQDRYRFRDDDTVLDVARLIQGAGFERCCGDLLQYMFYFERHDAYSSRGCLEVSDIDMAHYSKSGYRWKILNKHLEAYKPELYLNELHNEIKGLKEENANLIRKLHQPMLHPWMDDKLRKALDKDDKEEFICVIAGNLDFFRLRQQLILYAVCESGAIKCAQSLIKGETPLIVDLNLPCTDTGMYPLHCSALWFFPSLTELFLYNGARNDVRFAPLDWSFNFPQYELEAHQDKLPFHIALLGISHFPCISEWTLRHSIINLVTLFCLPRMQNSLETLGLLANTTKGMSQEFVKFATDRKFVELTALLMVAQRDARKSLLNKILELDMSGSMWSHGHREKIMELVKVFEHVGDAIMEYVEIDKYNVSKDQTSKDVRFLFDEKGFELCSSDTDLSVYNWYHDEEHSYPSEAPYEDVRLLHDFGMEHFSKLPYRWEARKYTYIQHSPIRTKIWKAEIELQCLKKKNRMAKEKLQQVSDEGIFVRHGVPVLSLKTNLFSHDPMGDIVVNQPCQSNPSKFFSTSARASMALSTNFCSYPNVSSTMTIGTMKSSQRDATGLGKSRACITLNDVQGKDGYRFGLYGYQTRPIAISNQGFLCGFFALAL